MPTVEGHIGTDWLQKLGIWAFLAWILILYPSSRPKMITSRAVMSCAGNDAFAPSTSKVYIPTYRFPLASQNLAVYSITLESIIQRYVIQGLV